MLASSSRQTITLARTKICTATSHLALNLDGLIPRRTINRRHAASQTQPEVQGDATSPSLSTPSSGDATSPRPSRLRNEPWSFTPDYTFHSRHHVSSLARFQVTISQLAEEGKFIDCLRACKAMKENGVVPDLLVYNDLLKAAARDGLHREADGIMDDMIAVGVRPDRQSYHHLIHAKRALETDHMWAILEDMQKHRMSPTAQTYSLILERPLMGGHLELAVQYLGEMNRHGIVPELLTAQNIIILAATLGHSRLALDIATTFEEASVRRLGSEVWVNCLISSAENLFAKGVSVAWDKVVNDLRITPDEGLCLEVLHTVARHGMADLGTEVLRVLNEIGAPWQEHHLACMIEAFCKENRLKEAFETLHVMRENGITPVAETAHPIFSVIKKHIDIADESWGLLSQLQKEGKGVDISAINVIIQAAVYFKDLPRAIGAYKALPDYGIQPNIETFHLLLSACIALSHRNLGDHLLSEMKKASLKPDIQTYERLIILCLTQTNYEDAFFYLEEMKGHKFLPTIGIYDAIIKRCVSVGDSRYTLALEEMKQCGYPVSQTLSDFITHGGEVPQTNEEEAARRPSS